MNNRYTLFVKYITGECAFQTDEPDLISALAEFDRVRKEEFSSATADKTFALPDIVSAKLIKTYYRRNS